jgi:putative tryptophan/tyrosine transport system substrate-binding protein
MMRRMALMCVVFATFSSAPAAAAERIWRVGVLGLTETAGVVPSVILPYLTAHGFIEGHNLVVETQIGSEEELTEKARALVSGKPDAIIALSDWALHAARAATNTIPIVVSPMGADPIFAGVAESWAHPGGNVTGVSLRAPNLEYKRLSLLHEALPSVHRVAALSYHRKIIEPNIIKLRKTADEFGLELVNYWVGDPNEYPDAFAAIRAAGAEALLIVPTPETGRDTEQLAALALRSGLPTIGGFRESARDGLLIGYGPSLKELGLQAAGYVERIFKGSKPSELPFQGPTHLDFTVNLKTAKILGLSIPASLLVSADEVIE